MPGSSRTTGKAHCGSL